MWLLHFYPPGTWTKSKACVSKSLSPFPDTMQNGSCTLGTSILYISIADSTGKCWKFAVTCPPPIQASVSILPDGKKYPFFKFDFSLKWPHSCEGNPSQQNRRGATITFRRWKRKEKKKRDACQLSKLPRLELEQSALASSQMRRSCYKWALQIN